MSTVKTNIQKLSELMQRAFAKQPTYEKKRYQQADSEAERVKQLYDDLIATTEKQYRQSASETEASYRAGYDANAVAELVARRRAAEAIANTNAADSGLNNTQQTAISLMRGNADAATTRQKQAAVDRLMRELDAMRTKYQAASTQEQLSIYREAADDTVEYEATVEAESNKVSQYEQNERDRFEQLYDQYGEDALYDENGNLSHAAVYVGAKMILKREGNVFAETFLTQCVNNQYITKQQKDEIMAELKIPEIDRPSEAEVRAEVERIFAEKGFSHARLYVTQLYKSGMIGVRIRENMYDYAEILNSQ